MEKCKPIQSVPTPDRLGFVECPAVPVLTMAFDCSHAQEPRPPAIFAPRLGRGGSAVAGC